MAYCLSLRYRRARYLSDWNVMYHVIDVVDWDNAGWCDCGRYVVEDAYGCKDNYGSYECES